MTPARRRPASAFAAEVDPGALPAGGDYLRAAAAGRGDRVAVAGMDRVVGRGSNGIAVRGGEGVRRTPGGFGLSHGPGSSSLPDGPERAGPGSAASRTVSVLQDAGTPVGRF